MSKAITKEIRKQIHRCFYYLQKSNLNSPRMGIVRMLQDILQVSESIVLNMLSTKNYNPNQFAASSGKEGNQFFGIAWFIEVLQEIIWKYIGRVSNLLLKALSKCTSSMLHVAIFFFSAITNGSDHPMGVNLSGFLFGNIDQSGNLENDVFDLETQRQLSSLGRLAFESILKEVIGEATIQDLQESQSQDTRSQNDSEVYFSQTCEKSPTAEDFFDINETAEDEDYNAADEKRNNESSMPPPPLPTMSLENQSEFESSYEEKPKNNLSLKSIQSDDEEFFLNPVEQQNESNKEDLVKTHESRSKAADWRFGPAQIWYDMLEVPETGDGFDYGFKSGDESIKVESPDREECTKDKPFPDDAFLMITQLHWEDDVVWDESNLSHEDMQQVNSKINRAAWVPSGNNRTSEAFNQPGLVAISDIPIPPTPSLTVIRSKRDIIPPKPLARKLETDDITWYSVLPVENEELVHGSWEDNVIWDNENMKDIPKPFIPTLDPNDENIILGIPDDGDPSKQIAVQPMPVKVKIRRPHAESSKMLLGKAGLIKVLQEDTSSPTSKSLHFDPFNISKDRYYQKKSYEPNMRLKVDGMNIVQHSTPVGQLRLLFVQSRMGPTQLRNFHRPPMKRYSHGPLSHPGPHTVVPFVKNMKTKAEVREQERLALGGGEVSFMRTAADLTARDGNIVLIEFSEEYPPLMNQVGMCSKIKNYYKRTAANDSNPPIYEYGETEYVHASPFLGILMPGQSIQSLENNMYRAPIYNHQMPSTDFLVIRTRQHYYIREIDSLFVAGQECPMFEVPSPNSRRVNTLLRDFMKVVVYLLFWKSRDHPRRIKMDDIKRVFPSHPESSIRNQLKLCADFKRTGTDSNWWVIKPEFRLPPEEEIRAMVSPEELCAYFSMLAAELRLKDAGYGEKPILMEEEEEEIQLKMDDEIKAAPWNTTKAYIQAKQGKCLLEITGSADPTGCGEGFSYVRVPHKPTQSKEEQESLSKKAYIGGTDADLRKLSLDHAKALLRKFGVPREEIKKLSRWEVIDVVRTLFTKKTEAGEEGFDKFFRGTRPTISARQESYKEECQRIFDLQNRILASAEVLSTDEGESSEDESDDDTKEMGKIVEDMLSNKKSSAQYSLEREEEERQELRKMIMECDKERKEEKKEEDESQRQVDYPQRKVLKIRRTFKDAQGKEYTRLEYVRNPAVIDAYVKIRTTKDESFIRQFGTIDEAQRKEMKLERRRIQDQLRRIKRSQYKARLSNMPNLFVEKLPNPNHEGPPSTNSTPPLTPKKTIKLKPDVRLKCGACGQVGHMKTNRTCPSYQNTDENTPISVALTVEQVEEMEKQLIPDDKDLVNIEGTKMTFSSKLIKHLEEVKRRSLLLKVPKDVLGKSLKRVATDRDYLKKPLKLANRRWTNPVVVLSSILEAILNEMRDMPESLPFRCPVNQNLVTDYHKIVQHPIDLQTIRENLRQKKYHGREEFLADVNQIMENSMLYNGPKSKFTIDATRMLTRCVERLRQKEDILMTLEVAINPLLDNDQVAFSYLLENIMNTKLKTLVELRPFHKPVNEEKVKDYYTIIKKPMDLETISQKIINHRYYNRHDFQVDVQQILENCVLYNGKDSSFTKNAELLAQTCKASLDELDEHLTPLEIKLSLQQQKAAQDDDNSMGTDEGGYHMDASSIGNAMSGKIPDVERDIILDETSLITKHLTKRFKAEQDDTLEKDLLISREDQLDNVPLTEFENKPDHNELSISSNFFKEGVENYREQAAEAIVQLDSMDFSQQQELNTSETLMFKGEILDDVDPSYDPSEYLMSRLAAVREVEGHIQGQDIKIQDDLAVSENDQHNQEMQQEPDDIPEDDDGVWF